MAQTRGVVAEIIAIPLAEIEVGQRLRPLDLTWADALGGVMAAEGQKTAIEVCRLPGRATYHLVAGAHRLEGARRRGLAAINAVVVDANALERRSREISENLWRLDLSALDRAFFVAELVANFKARNGIDPGLSAQSVAARARWQTAAKTDAADARSTFSHAYGWADEVGAQVGLSRRVIYLSLALHRGLAPDVAVLLHGSPIASVSSQLMALARLAPAEQREVAAFLRDGAAKTVSASLAILRQTPSPSAESKAWSAFFGGWSRMGVAMRREALAELSARLPPGWSIVREATAEEPGA